jgi:hypothetical protein
LDINTITPIGPNEIEWLKRMLTRK